MVASFQADTLIARRAIKGKSHLIVSRDSDLLAMVGPTCLSVDDYKWESLRRGANKGRTENKITKSLKSFDLQCCSKVTKEYALKAITDESDYKKVEVKDPSYPILDSTDSILRGTIAVIVGCDVLCGGVDGIGAAKINKEKDIFLQKKHDEKTWLTT